MTAILERAPAAFPGDVTRPGEAVIEPIFLAATNPPTEFGVPVKVVSNKAEKIAAGDTAAKFYGVLTRIAPSESGSLAQAFNEGVPSTSHFQGVIVKGYVAVKCAQGNPTRGGAVYMRVTAATGKNVGDFEADADGANSVALPGVIWATSYKDADNIAEIRIG